MGEPYREQARNVLPLLVNFLILIVVLPLIIDICNRLGLLVLGESLMASQGWLWIAIPYLPLLVFTLVYLYATLEPLLIYGVRWDPTWVGRSAFIGVIAAVVIYLIDVSASGIAEFGIPAEPTLVQAMGFVFAFGLLAPAAEELLFRGAMQTAFFLRIDSDWKVHPAVWLATAFEVLWHLAVPVTAAAQGEYLSSIGSTLPQLLYVAVFGTIGGYVYQRTHSLVGPFLIHAIGNGGELLLFWLLAA